MNNLLDDEYLRPKQTGEQRPLTSLRLLGGAVILLGFLWIIRPLVFFRGLSLSVVFILAFLMVWGLSLLSVFTLRTYVDGRLRYYRGGVVLLTVVVCLFIVWQGQAAAWTAMPPYLIKAIQWARYLFQGLAMYLPVLLVVRYGRIRARAADWWPTLERWALLLMVLQILENASHYFGWSQLLGEQAYWGGYLLSMVSTLGVLVLGVRHKSRTTKTLLIGTWVGYHLVLLAIYRAGLLTHVEELLILLGLILLLRTLRLAYQTQTALDQGQISERKEG